VSELAEALSESKEMKRQKNLASDQLEELRERVELEKENRSIRVQHLSNSSSFSESRDSAIDSDLPSGHYSIKVPTKIILKSNVIFSLILFHICSCQMYVDRIMDLCWSLEFIFPESCPDHLLQKNRI
jgi:hypothetical protein